MLESKRQARIVEWLEDEAGCTVIKLTTNRGYGRNGWPDLLVLASTLFSATRQGAHFIETKTPLKDLTTKQRYKMAQLREKGYPAMVAHGVFEVQAAWVPRDSTAERVWWEF